MNKQVDFGDDLAALNDNVSAAVGDVLEVLQQKRVVKRSESASTPEEKPPATSGEPVSSIPIAANQSRRQRTASRSRLTPTVDREEPLENVTTRLRQKTNELLTESALRQRLKKESPATRQDIIEAALGDWFRKHGYARGRDDEAAD